MSKKTVLTVAASVVISVILTAVVVYVDTGAAPPFVDSGEPEHPECQYPFRPLLNGQCDNSEPAGVPTSPAPQPTPPPAPQPPKQPSPCKG